MSEHKFSYYYYGNDRGDAYRILLKVNFEDSNIAVNKEIQMKLDTGASSVVVNANHLGIKLTENQFKLKFGLVSQNMVGIKRDTPVCYYRYYIKKMRIGGYRVT